MIQAVKSTVFCKLIALRPRPGRKPFDTVSERRTVRAGVGAILTKPSGLVARTLFLDYYQISIVSQGEKMPFSNRDFLSSYSYHILIDGKPGAGFAECGGLMAGQSQKPGHLTLERGAIATTEFFDWLMMQHSAPRALTIVLNNESREPVTSWELSGARVVRVTATTFTGTGFPFRLEELELSAESVTAGGKF
jgi:hypothetical protein